MEGDSGVRSHCCFCSMQCAVRLEAKPSGEGLDLRPDPGFPVAGGRLCQKGFHAHLHVSHPERLTTPLVRRRGGFAAVSWAQALEEAAARLQSIQGRYGAGAVGVFGGGSLTNETAYLLGKFARVALRTPFIDYNGRYCMSSAAAAMNRSFGLDRGLTNPLDDIPAADIILLVGANVAECQPTMMSYFRRAQKRGGRLVVIDPRETATARVADVHLRIRPGTDWILMNGLLRAMIAEGWIDEDFIARRTSGFEAVREAAAPYTPERVEARTGVPAGVVVDLARQFSLAPRGMIFTARGVEQQVRGVDNVQACINLILATGKIGRPGCGFGAITGQGNGQGGREHGQKADQLPGYRSIEDPAARRHVARVWGVDERDLPGPGTSAFEMFQQMTAGRIRGLLILGSNPVASSPHRSLVRRALASLDTLVVIDILPSETARMADILLPGSAWTEQEGTTTNLEGRVILRRQATSPPGRARLDWRILCDLAAALGKGRHFSYSCAEEIFHELRRASAGGEADYFGITYERIERENGVFWPCPDLDRPGQARLFADRFAHPDGRARFFPVSEEGRRPEQPDMEYPFYLTTGRVVDHYLTGTQTRRTERLVRRTPGPYVEIHPETAAAFGIGDGERVRLRTRRGKAEYPAKVTDRIRPDTLFVPCHWEGDECVNQLTDDRLDPISRMPSFKCCAAALEKVGAEHTTSKGEDVHAFSGLREERSSAHSV
ncbi:molybdopterin oxidoreductase family protein [Kyrpidia tusciae]|uniref:Molybdopterin oxidoreductase n=1 Tax=Kyrpidia tusciae (strain DSM 2912 / NBRC 15312 / T2) TaxID=562970 RepID=D5WXH2_KYRT2|nr:molybdopterin oxidoreductase family protein [Kyrpidia tusciae]ADG05893.1 molybdopterin oxidoreductase [Kyrpidia tusciae DSM 2912]